MNTPKTTTKAPALKTWIVEAESSITGALITVAKIDAPTEAAALLAVIGPKPWNAQQRARRARYMIRRA